MPVGLLAPGGYSEHEVREVDDTVDRHSLPRLGVSVGIPESRPLLVVSYDHEDRERVAPLVSRFRKRGFWVFWDRDTRIGAQWREVIDDRLRHASCVIVVWTRRSVKSTWVRAEADTAAQNGVLKAVRLDDVKPPLPFGEYQYADLIGWDGGAHPELRRLLSDVSRVLSGALPVRGWAPLEFERDSSRSGVSEARGFVKRIRAQSKMFKENPAAAAALREALKGVADTYNAVNHTVEEFLVPLTADRAPSTNRYRAFATGRLNAEIEANRGHCTQIAQAYIEEGGLPRQLAGHDGG